MTGRLPVQRLPDVERVVRLPPVDVDQGGIVLRRDLDDRRQQRIGRHGFVRLALEILNGRICHALGERRMGESIDERRDRDGRGRPKGCD